ncbi:cation:proton antiporter [Photobacterium sp. TY1-4]|uniref:cation:proton antiporter n=1 Tax=Photobacterium sp. TY1-4 TaxID=2899122 RepID=UPI0021BE442D|nr:sodium:proton antiporter [Photobacterium sp. TY1-4]UXI03804.1 sodium:proton antiporter [Photobacterium sp. TY1-4]
MTDSSFAFILALFTFLLAAVVAKEVSRRSRLPYSITLILAGLAMHAIQPSFSLPIDPLSEKELAHDVILYILLPTLVFETAYNLDISKLTANRVAIFVLAIPGVLISSIVVATIVYYLTPLSWQYALLLGAILSATDPTAVIAAFRQLNAPKDLIMLIEGESLFNDATAITLTKVLVLSFALSHGFWPTLGHGSGLFAITLLGGVICGWLFARLALWSLQKMPDDPFSEISLSLLMAFGCYLFAEKALEVSGIVAAAVAGISLATHAPLPVSKKSQQYLNHFWSYLSFIASASIFLIVGLWTDLGLLWDNITISVIILAAIWLSRAAIAYGLLPYIGHLQRQAKSTPMAFRHLMFVGGMRGAVTLALAMGLVSVLGDETLLSITTGVVFLTILLQGILITPLARHFQLKEKELSDSIATAELTLSTLHHSRKVLQSLLNSELAHGGIPQALSAKLDPLIAEQEKQLQAWFSAEVGPIGLWNRLLLRCASLEIGYLYRLFDQGLIKAAVYQELKNSLDEQMEAIRHQYQRPTFSHFPQRLSGLLTRLWQPITHPHPQRQALIYEMAWARLMSCQYVLNELALIIDDEEIPETVATHVAGIWQGWQQECETQISQIEHLQPDTATAVQQQLVRNFLRTAQAEHLQQYVQQCLISEDDAAQLLRQLESMDL